MADLQRCCSREAKPADPYGIVISFWIFFTMGFICLVPVPMSLWWPPQPSMIFLVDYLAVIGVLFEVGAVAIAAIASYYLFRGVDGKVHLHVLRPTLEDTTRAFVRFHAMPFLPGRVFMWIDDSPRDRLQSHKDWWVRYRKGCLWIQHKGTKQAAALPLEDWMTNPELLPSSPAFLEQEGALRKALGHPDIIRELNGVEWLKRGRTEAQADRDVLRAALAAQREIAKDRKLTNSEYVGVFGQFADGVLQWRIDGPEFSQRDAMELEADFRRRLITCIREAQKAKHGRRPASPDKGVKSDAPPSAQG